MLSVAKRKMPQIAFVQASADDLPLEDNSVDIISISYGIRNVVNREEAIREFRRVLKPGGLLVILEFTKEEEGSYIPIHVASGRGFMRSLADEISRHVMLKNDPE